ncbi:hypothetical protein K9N68_32210 [Kovacikia minuta CCNUW1]|uniref:hypothetical protein n=1 Tax=Kovacikia minuta TaxID=2931930 RepID=UPI001CCBB3E0|nr:hypothetical protein [Kovacikia minuta]UBF26138.1 hypothetical protein K9N68_32210 [Kovacikia minuta CCNUW1]
MYTQICYLMRSKTDGSYLVAHLSQDSDRAERTADTGHLLIFREHFDALSYINTHGSGVADRFAVESIPGSQLEGLLKRWGFLGIGIVQDPLIPKIEFLTRK